MTIFKPQKAVPAAVLATDLDGTLIPLPMHGENRRALEALNQYHQAAQYRLVFATGRHFDSVVHAMQTYGLPQPEWVVCDVGTSVYRRDADRFTRYAPFDAYLTDCAGGARREDVEGLVDGVADLMRQPPDHQQRFKLSYDCAARDLLRLAGVINERLRAAALPWHCLSSLDPFRGIGLIDVLPGQASKAAALIWLAGHADFTPDEVVYAGDSGNDRAALVCGFRAIVVANADADLVTDVAAELEQRGLGDYCFHAPSPATSGVLEGCRHYGLCP